MIYDLIRYFALAWQYDSVRQFNDSADVGIELVFGTTHLKSYVTCVSVTF